MKHIDNCKGAAVLPHPGGNFLTIVIATSGVLVRTPQPILT